MSDAHAVPPSDLDAEAAVLSALLLDAPKVADVEGVLEARHFFADANRNIYEAILALHAGGSPVNIVSLAGRLRDTNKLGAVGGPPYLARLSDAIPAVAHVEDHALRIRSIAAKRNAVELAKRMAIEGANGVGDVGSWLTQKQEQLARVALDVAPVAAKRDPWSSSQTAAIFTEAMAPMKWAVEGLGIGPGRPCGLWGKATGGKTLEAIDIALSKASGTKAFGRFAVERGRVLWISYDFPRRPLHTRFRQLANGRGLTPQDLDGMIETCVFPEIYLNSEGAEAKLAKRCAGFDLVVLDCYRDSIPGTEENSSEQAVYLKSLARISDAQGTSFLYLHHLKKGQESEESTIDSGRGSGAIAAASGSLWALEGTGNKPRLMRNIRPHDACTDFAAPFYIELILGGPGGPFPCDEQPIRLEARTEAEMAGDAFFSQVERNKAGLRDRLDLLVRLLRAHPNCTLRQLRDQTKGTALSSHAALDSAIDEALDLGLITRTDQTGRGGARKVHNVAAQGTP